MEHVQVEYRGTNFMSTNHSPGYGQLNHESSALPAVSTECAEKVEAMLSTAVLHLADLWNMLTVEFSEGVAFDPDTALLTPVTEIPPLMLVAMKSKLENSLEWCQLARSRLTDITRPASPKQYVISTFPSTTTLQQPKSLWPVHQPHVSPELRTYSFAAPSL